MPHVDPDAIAFEKPTSTLHLGNQANAPFPLYDLVLSDGINPGPTVPGAISAMQASGHNSSSEIRDDARLSSARELRRGRGDPAAVDRRTRGHVAGRRLRYQGCAAKRATVTTALDNRHAARSSMVERVPITAATAPGVSPPSAFGFCAQSPPIGDPAEQPYRSAGGGGTSGRYRQTGCRPCLAASACMSLQTKPNSQKRRLCRIGSRRFKVG